MQRYEKGEGKKRGVNWKNRNLTFAVEVLSRRFHSETFFFFNFERGVVYWQFTGSIDFFFLKLKTIPFGIFNIVFSAKFIMLISHYSILL